MVWTWLRSRRAKQTTIDARATWILNKRNTVLTCLDGDIDGLRGDLASDIERKHALPRRCPRESGEAGRCGAVKESARGRGRADGGGGRRGGGRSSKLVA